MAHYQALVSCILVLIGLSASGVQGQFPYCRCIDKSQGSSPYALVISSIKSSSSSLTATFTVVNATAPANPSACYKKILASGAPKFEIDSSTICLAAGNKPVIKINGVISTASGIVAPPNYNGKASIKTKFIPNYKGAATTITITGYGACANWNTLFNSKSTGVFSFAVFSTEGGGLCCPSGTVYAAPPPPKPVAPGDSPYAPGQLAPPGPAPGPPFPFCRCNQSVTASPYDFSGDFAVKAEDKVTWYTGTVGSKSCNPASSCCNMGLDKIELHIRDACKGSVAKYAYVTTAGTPPVTQARTISYASYGPGRMTLKLARLPWTAATAGDATFAFALLKNSACPTLSSLLAGKGQIAFFNKGNACCPTYSGF